MDRIQNDLFRNTGHGRFMIIAPGQCGMWERLWRALREMVKDR